MLWNMQDDMDKAVSFGSLLHEKLSNRGALSEDENVSDGWFLVASELLFAVRSTREAWEELHKATRGEPRPEAA
jgi:hypothetical protein